MGKGFGGFPGAGGGLGNIMKQAQKMQADLAKAQEQAAHYIADGEAGGGMVNVKVDGKFEVISVDINPQAIDPNDREMLQDMVKAAINDGLKKIKDNQKQEMAKVTGGMNIPGLF